MSEASCRKPKKVENGDQCYKKYRLKELLVTEENGHGEVTLG